MPAYGSRLRLVRGQLLFSILGQPAALSLEVASFCCCGAQHSQKLSMQRSVEDARSVQDTADRESATYDTMSSWSASLVCRSPEHQAHVDCISLYIDGQFVVTAASCSWLSLWAVRTDLARPCIACPPGRLHQHEACLWACCTDSAACRCGKNGPN